MGSSRNRVRYDPKGELELRITGEHGFAVSTWTDGKVRRIEDQLNEIIVSMLIVIEKMRRSREDRKREETARLEREQERHEQERLRQIEQARAEQFEALAGRWQKAGILRRDVEAVKEKAIRQFGASSQRAGWPGGSSGRPGTSANRSPHGRRAPRDGGRPGGRRGLSRAGAAHGSWSVAQQDAGAGDVYDPIDVRHRTHLTATASPRRRSGAAARRLTPCPGRLTGG